MKVWICKVLKDIGAARSNGESRRLVQMGAVSICGVKLIDADAEIEGPCVIRVGPNRRYEWAGGTP